MFKSTGWKITGGVVLALVVLWAFIRHEKDTVPVRADRATRQSISNNIQTNGKIEPVNNFEAHAPIATTVRRVLVAEGDRVKKGQLLLQLDDAAARAQAAKAVADVKAADADLAAVKTGGTHEQVISTEAQLVKARTSYDAAARNLAAMQRLEKTGAASAQEVVAAQNQLTASQAELGLAQQQLKSRYSRPEVQRVVAQKADAEATLAAARDVLRDSDVVAPQDGTVYSLPVRIGQYVNTGDLLVQVANLSTVQVRTFVDEPDIGKLAKGEKVSVTWDAIPGRTWTGTVTRVPSSVKVVGTRTVGEVTCAVDNSDFKLIPNINVDVDIMTARDENALTVSREAMHQEESKRYVLEIVHGVLQKREVQTSVSNLTRIEITSGLQDGAEVALDSTNGAPLEPGMHVKVVQR